MKHAKIVLLPLMYSFHQLIVTDLHRDCPKCVIDLILIHLLLTVNVQLTAL